MPDPRVFIIRHGETEWSLNGRHTGISDIPLTANGEKRVRATGKALVGHDRLIVPGNLAHIYVSPRTRAQKTLELLNLGCKDRYPWSHSNSTCSSSQQQQEEQDTPDIRTHASISVTESIREWDYGAYEGLTSAQIKQQQHHGPNWDIWRDGCPGGESPDDVTARLDAFIHDLRAQWHAGTTNTFETTTHAKPRDVLIVAHGHILRALAARWVGRPLAENPSLILEAGGVGTLSYEHHSIDEPAILLGGAFVVDVVEKEQEEKEAKAKA